MRSIIMLFPYSWMSLITSHLKIIAHNISTGTSGEYEDCHGFEIELEDLPCSDVYYTFSYNRYGMPAKTDTLGGCVISYESGYDDVLDQWLVGTPVPLSLKQVGKVVPTNGHSCFSSGQNDYATSGCEHFRVSLAAGKSPTSTKYRWLVANPNSPGTLMQSSTRVGIPAVNWSVRPAAGVNGGNVVAAVIEAEPPEPVCGLCSKWGEPKWVKVFVTEIEYEVDLDHLLTDGEEVPQSQNETEMEWVLLQSPPTCDGDTCVEIAFNNSENELAVEQEAGDASKTIIRRYEFYEYAGEVNAEDNEAQPNSVMAGCEGNPVGCDIVGNYLGAQMAAAVLGLGDSLQFATQSPVMGGATGVNYLLMLTAVGGVAPYSWSLSSGALFSGLGITIDGWITGVPTESGTRTFDITVEDFNQDSVTKSVTLTIVGPSSTTTEAATTVAPGTTEGSQAATTTDSVTTKTIEAPSSTTTEAATTASPGTTEGTQATTTTDFVTTEAPPTSDWSSLLSSLDVSCLVPDG